MVDLPDVTLLTVNSNDPSLGLKALERCIGTIANRFDYGSIKLLSHIQPSYMPDYVEYVRIPHISSIHDYNVFCITELYKYVNTTLVLSVQTDGFIINPHLWSTDFCCYDYIGAVWPSTVRGMRQGQPVGNSGFCMRSKLLLELTSKIAKKYGLPNRCKDDLFACAEHYPKLVAAGIQFAPIEVASKFSFEMPVRGVTKTTKETFGFHGKRTRETQMICAGLN